MAVSRWAIRPPVHDSAVARVAPVRLELGDHGLGDVVVPSPRMKLAEPLADQAGGRLGLPQGLLLGRPRGRGSGS